MSKSSIDEYLKESVKSYQACQVKNSARRSSLQKKTEGIEMARKKMTSHMDREEKLLRRQLSNMQLDQIRREVSSPLLEVRRSESPARQRTRKISSITSRELQGQEYAARRGRRVSKEFEDLTMISSTGKLLLNSKSKDTRAFSPLIQRLGVSESLTSLPSTEDLDLVENKSVRRPRKSVQQQQYEKAVKSTKI